MDESGETDIMYDIDQEKQTVVTNIKSKTNTGRVKDKPHKRIKRGKSSSKGSSKETSVVDDGNFYQQTGGIYCHTCLCL